ncbi:DegT/DnrJ/EryC1/StrS family aminotransferase [Vibrio astriarenae]|uniref:DegT/DnrJ/EryC1/StrS family aminotransferase n=1 Tax=Vibrio astriarenae TaxID=1481923 RepID=UPI003734D593
MLPVTKPYLPNIGKYKKYIDEIFDSCHLTNSGPLLQKLEVRLAEYLGVKHVICVANGTLALQVAYKALGLRGKVITTPFSFAATSSSLIWEGLEPVFCDIDENTFNLDPRLINELIDDDTSCILPVHVFGNPCEVKKIETIAKEHNLKIIYDAAHAFGVDYLGKSLVSYGDISTVSFHATKLFHTIEGGAVITDCDEIATKARRLINFGIQNGELVDRHGTNAKMNEFEAAMGLCVLDDIEQIKKARSELVVAYDALLPSNVQRQQLSQEASQLLSYMPIKLDSEEQLKRVKLNLENNGVFPRRYFYPSLDTTYSDSNEVTKSQQLASRILCLPLYVDMTPEDVKLISLILAGALE